MIPIKNLVKQMETLLQCYCFETVAMCRHPERQDAYVHRLAKDLAQFLALFLAETVTELLQSVLAYPSKGLYNAPLLTPKFWVQAIYTELLHASGRYRAVREQEQKRPPTGLVKLLCLSYAQRHGGSQREIKDCTPLSHMFNSKGKKTHQRRTTFGRSDVEKWHAAVARSTLTTENYKNMTVSGHSRRERCQKTLTDT